MAKKTDKPKHSEISVKRIIIGAILLAATLFLAVAVATHDPADWPNSSQDISRPIHNTLGPEGARISYWLVFVALGHSAWAVVGLLGVAGIMLVFHRSLSRRLVKLIAFIISFGLFAPLLAGLVADRNLGEQVVEAPFRYGGCVGGFLAEFLVRHVYRSGAYFLPSLVLVSVTSWILGGRILAALAKSIGQLAVGIWHALLSLAASLWSATVEATRQSKAKKTPVSRKGAARAKQPKIDGMIPDDDNDDPFLTPIDEEPDDDHDPARTRVVPAIHFPEDDPDVDAVDVTGDELDAFGEDEGDDDFDMGDDDEEGEPARYELPGIELLDFPEKVQANESRDEMLEKAAEIVQSLRHFNIETEVRQITPGPLVTRYELILAPGIKVGKVVNLADDLALALRAPGPIRILAPIPGKAAIGIEVPNKVRATVYYRDIVESAAFTSSDRPLVLALGKTTSGEPVVADLARMPHLLIAGSTGAGKSVCINTIVASILMRATPDDVRMIMIDPKVVELSIYTTIPHLLAPVVTEPKRAAKALEWAVREMEHRYRRLASMGVRDIGQYNAKREERALADPDGDNPRHMPYIVIIIDEFADLMVVSSAELEESIARLAQMARAVGIHLVLATQRPSADVITGLIKANFPSRIAFKVMQASNSRIILDQGGADKLLGFGDMLFLQVGRPEPFRLHGAFISGDESQRLVDHATGQQRPDLPVITDELEEAGDTGGDDLGMRDPNARDVLFFKAARLVVRTNQGSVSLLQRRLKVGYARAARLIDQLEHAGIVSPYDGSKAREVRVDDAYIDELESGDLDIL